MLNVRGVVVRFGGLVAVDTLDLEVPERGVFLLVGPNGAGKTTLINALTRVSPVSQGTATLDGTDLLRLQPHDVIKHGIARSFQRAELFGSLSVVENIMVGLTTSGSRRLDRQRAEALLKRLDMSRLGDLSPTSLPYGYQKLLDVARAMVSEPKLLLLDEPFAGITSDEAPALIDCIVDAGKRCAVLMVEHHLELVMKIAQRVTVLNFGRKIAEGSPAHVRNDAEVIRCYLGTGRKQHADGIATC